MTARSKNILGVIALIIIMAYIGVEAFRVAMKMGVFDTKSTSINTPPRI